MNYMETLETKRLILRKPMLDDCAAFQTWCGNPENTRYMSFGPNTEEQTREWLSQSKPCKDFAVVLKDTGAVIGSCGIYPKGDNYMGELGWILHMDYWKRGYGTELGGELIRYGFEDLKLGRIQAPCAAVNYGSYRVMERNGMRREALHRKAFWARIDKVWVDEAWYAILADDYYKTTADPFDIRPIDADSRQLVTAFINEHWFGTDMLIRGEVIDMTKVDGYALIEKNMLSGVITYIVRDDICEITSLDSVISNRGVGTQLVDVVKNRARELDCRVLRLMTTNDNLNAIGFYQKRGFEIVGINLGAIDLEREQKPSIPLVGQNGIPMHHEIELQMYL